MAECNHMMFERARVKPKLYKCKNCGDEFTSTEIYTRMAEQKLQMRAVLIDNEVFNLRLMPQTGPDVTFG